MLEIEINDTILSANLIEIGDLPEEITGEINDDLAPEDDVDLFEVELSAGDTLFADINISTADSDLDSVLSVFDADGNLLVQNDDNSFEDEDGEIVTEAESFLQFVPIQNGTYYIGVSSSQNLEYDPTVAGSGSGDSFGSYSLVLSVEEFTIDDLAAESNDTIDEANLIELDLEAPVTVAGEIGDNATSTRLSAEDDVDLFAVELNAGDILSADINAEVIGSELDAVLSLFDAEGNLITQNDGNSFIIEEEEVTELDPFSQWIALENGTYYVGVSSSDNLEYDPTVAGSGSGDSSGFYRLVLSIEEFEIDELAAESNDIIDEANLIELDLEAPVTVSGEIGDNATSIFLSPEDDVDLFAVELEEGDILLANINAEAIGSDLDAVLSIFDINGELLTQNDDNSFEDEFGEIVTELDSFAQLNAPADGTYYVGVSSFENLEYDPNVAISSRGSGDSVGFYDLVLSFGEEIPVEEVNEEISSDDVIPTDS
ncbi:MAG: DVUA0089 family protein [Cyanobacteria bacterium P01_F01_bin.143]